VPKYDALGEKLTVHSFRHTYATLMAEAGIDQFALKNVLGHAQLSTTDRYVHPTAPVLPFPLKALKGSNSMAKSMATRKPDNVVRLVSRC